MLDAFLIFILSRYDQPFSHTSMKELTYDWRQTKYAWEEKSFLK
jgi:hypothetical protein